MQINNHEYHFLDVIKALDDWIDKKRTEMDGGTDIEGDFIIDCDSIAKMDALRSEFKQAWEDSKSD